MLGSQVLGLIRQYLAQFAASSGFLGLIADIDIYGVDNSGLLRVFLEPILTGL